MTDRVELVVPGEPVPWQRARKRGKQHFRAPAVVEYEERVQAAWLVEGRPQLGSGPLELSARFYLGRKQSHLRADGSVKPSAPAYPRCDVDNLVKGVADALTTLLYPDDSQIVRLRLVEKHYAEPGEEPRTELEVGAVGPSAN